jgi:hypothetical protein
MRKTLKRRALGLIIPIDDGWGTETNEQWEARKDQAFLDYQKGLSTNVTSSDYSSLDKIIAEREAKRLAEQEAKYNTVKPIVLSTPTVTEQNTQKITEQKTSWFAEYAKSGQLAKDFQTLSEANKVDIKTAQDAYFAENPTEKSNFRLDTNTGVYLPKEKTNYAFWAVGGLIGVGLIGTIWYVMK